MGNATPFEPKEFQARLGRIQEKMRVRGAQALIVDVSEYMGYLSGYEVSLNMYRALIVPASGKPVMILRELDEAPYLELTWLDEHVTFRDWDDPIDIVAKFLQRKGYANATIAVDLQSYALTVSRYEALRQLLPKATFIDMADELLRITLIKSEPEIAYQRKAASIVDTVMTETIGWAKEGISEREVQAFVSAGFFKHGADHGLVGPITAGTGENFLHGLAHNRALQRGDILHLELVPKYRGYTSRLMRSTLMGKPTAEQYEVAAKLVELQDKQLQAIHPDALGRDVDAICRQGIIDAGWRSVYNNVTGYTLGFYPASTVRSSNFYRAFLPNADWQFEAGMVFHAYASARGIAFSETVLVTPTGHERLTKMERKLFSK